MTPEAEAILCARASEAIYDASGEPADQKICEQKLGPYGFSKFIWPNFETLDQDLCAFIATSADCHLLCFRGTKQKQDWLTDAKCCAEAFSRVFDGAPDIGEIHGGFSRCLATEIHQIEAALRHRDRSKPLLVTGHSLGGALAVLASIYLTVVSKDMIPVARIYTFGQPRVGVQKFCDRLTEVFPKKIVRFVHGKDIVPHIPLTQLRYADAGTMIHYDSSGIPTLESVEHQNVSATMNQPFDVVRRFFSDFELYFADHSVEQYRALTEQNEEQLRVLLANIL
jgi:hypothetical protein